MEVKSCKMCKSLFNYIGGVPLCPKCKEELEEKFQQVKEYINEHKSASMSDIAKDNEVPVQQIKQWVREERLIFTEDSAIMLECENCGAQIRTGRFCDKCKSETFRGISELGRKKEAPKVTRERKERERMRFLDN
ncbi:MAG: flagellar protein [Parasporobacterium sp.]|nr:flagellar protein [Parasporobacterium sp.]